MPIIILKKFRGMAGLVVVLDRKKIIISYVTKIYIIEGV
jgi:hypothetical protein